MADKGSFISRFIYKILEIAGAAVATAVSGYLVAHLGGFLPSHTQAPTPPAVAVAPSERPVAKSIPASVSAKEPPATVQPTQSAAAPAAAEAPDHRASQTPMEATGSAAPTTPRNANGKTAAKPSRKNGKSEAAAAPEAKARETADTKSRETAEAKSREAAEAKSRETAEAKSREAAEAKSRETAEAKSRETAEAKSRGAEDKDSVEAQVKAALANVDANRHGDGTPNFESAPVATAPAGQPRSADLGTPVQRPATQPVSSQSPAAQSAPPVPAPVQIAPVQPAPPQQPDALTSVEIKSRPIATIDTPAAPQAAPPQEEEKGVASFFKRILPDLRRPTPTDEAPRPPAPVGE